MIVNAVVTGLGVAASLLGCPADILAPPPGPPAGFEPASVMGRRGFRYVDRATQLGLLAASRALHDAELLEPGRYEGGLAVPGDDVGVVVSSNRGNLDTVCRAAQVIASETIAGSSPMDLPNASSNVIASFIALRFGLRGPNLMLCNGAASGLDAIYLAATLIGAGRISAAVAVGVEPRNAVVASLEGMAAGELFDGATAMILESPAGAAARGRRPRARIAGYARGHDTRSSALGALGGAGEGGEGTLPGLWLVTQAVAGPAELSGAPRHDVEAALGSASGALGVLQAAAAAQWLDDGGSAPALATAGAADGTASVVLDLPVAAR